MIKELKDSFLIGMEHDAEPYDYRDVFYENRKKETPSFFSTTLRRIKGIYALCECVDFENHNIVYIGTSVNMLSRIKQHRYNKRYDFSILYEVCKCSLENDCSCNLYELEKELIKKYKPKYNFQYK